MSLLWLMCFRGLIAFPLPNTDSYALMGEIRLWFMLPVIWLGTYLPTVMIIGEYSIIRHGSIHLKLFRLLWKQR
jgi:hypothetical protein